jgi:hypothetical protein
MSGRGSGLRFIIVDPASDPSHSGVIREVRSHAGRWTWQQGRRSQPETADGIGSDGDDTAHRDLDNLGQLVLTHQTPPAPTPANRPSPSTLDPFQTYVSAPISIETVSVSNKYCTPTALARPTSRSNRHQLSQSSGLDSCPVNQEVSILVSKPGSLILALILPCTAPCYLDLFPIEELVFQRASDSSVLQTQRPWSCHRSIPSPKSTRPSRTLLKR